MSHRPGLKLAIIGLPEEWDSRYGPAVRALFPRVEVAGLYAPCPARGEAVAAQVGAPPLHGLRKLLEQDDLGAVVVLDLGWQGSWAARQCHRARLPTFVGQRVLRSSERWDTVSDWFETDEFPVVPECLLRYHPAMLRLRELIATELGALTHATFFLARMQHSLDPELKTRDVVNWFLALCGASAARRTVCSGSSIGFACQGRRGASVSLQVDQQKVPSVSDAADETGSTFPFCVATCERGIAEILSSRSLRWGHQDDFLSEQLDGDRSATDVALDLFVRRAAGGLIPVPGFSDLLRAEQVASEDVSSRSCKAEHSR